MKSALCAVRRERIQMVVAPSTDKQLALPMRNMSLGFCRLDLALDDNGDDDDLEVWRMKYIYMQIMGAVGFVFKSRVSQIHNLNFREFDCRLMIVGLVSKHTRDMQTESLHYNPPYNQINQTRKSVRNVNSASRSCEYGSRKRSKFRGCSS